MDQRSTMVSTGLPLRPALPSPRECRWYVQAMHVTATDADGTPTEGIPVSPVSDTWMFVWAKGGGGALPPQSTVIPMPGFRP